MVRREHECSSVSSRNIAANKRSMSWAHACDLLCPCEGNQVIVKQTGVSRMAKYKEGLKIGIRSRTTTQQASNGVELHCFHIPATRCCCMGCMRGLS